MTGIPDKNTVTFAGGTLSFIQTLSILDCGQVQLSVTNVEVPAVLHWLTLCIDLQVS